MANRLLTSDTYHDEVRGKLGVGKDVVSDEAIDAVTVAKIAENRVIDRVAHFCDYTTLDGDDKDWLYAAAVTMAASLLAPTIASRIYKSEGDTDYKYTNNDVDWKQRAEDLVEEAYSYIDYISVQPVVELRQVGASGPTRTNCSLSNRTMAVADDLFYRGG